MLPSTISSGKNFDFILSVLENFWMILDRNSSVIRSAFCRFYWNSFKKWGNQGSIFFLNGLKDLVRISLGRIGRSRKQKRRIYQIILVVKGSTDSFSDLPAAVEADSKCNFNAGRFTYQPFGYFTTVLSPGILYEIPAFIQQRNCSALLIWAPTLKADLSV